MVKGQTDFVKYHVQTDESKKASLTLPVEKTNLMQTSKTIDTDWFATDIVPTVTPSTMRIFMMVATGTVVRVEITDTAPAVSDKEIKLNEAIALTAGCGYFFDIILLANQTFNIQHATATQNIFCTVVEVSALV